MPGDGPFGAELSLVSGTVVTASGVPVVGAPVRVMLQRFRQPLPVGDGRCDARGHYEARYQVPERAKSRVADIAVEVLDPAGVVIATSAVRFNAGAEEQIDVVLPGEVPEPAEFVRVGAALLGALEGTDPAQIGAADLAYLAGKTGEDPALIATFAAAHKLAAATRAQPEVFYGLLRSELPDSLAAVLTQGRAAHAEALREASRAGIVGEGAVAEAAKLGKRLRDATVARIVEGSARPDGPALGRLVGGALPDRDRQVGFLRAWLDFDGTPARFWAELERGGAAGDARAVGELQFTFQAAALADGHVGLVERLRADRRAGRLKSFRDAAGLAAADWRKLIDESPDAGRLGKDDKAKLARNMERMLEDAYPTAALAGKLARRPGSPLHDKQVLDFLAANPTFDLLHGRVAAALPDGGGPPAAGEVTLRSKLEKLQRLFRLSPRVDATEALYQAGYGSAGDVARAGKELVVTTLASKLGRQDSVRLYERADHTAASAMALYARFGASLNSLGTAVTPAIPEGAEDGVADWETLFGSISLCTCEHCRSIYSPAAYLVDVLAFLDGIVHPDSGSSALDVLLDRRPGIQHLLLSCENATTEVPYIDLVIELLEIAVLAGGQPPRPVQPQTQTSGTAAELAAYPQHLHSDVYDTDLAGAVFPWTLPFSLWAVEAAAYLGDLGVERRELLEAGHPGPAAAMLRDPDVCAEVLGLTGRQWRIVAGLPLTPPQPPQAFWGFGTGQAATWVAELGKVPVLLDRSGLAFADLVSLLDLRFIDPAGTVEVVAPGGTCDTDEMTVAGLTQPALDRIHRFERLRRALGWTTRQLDRVLAAVATRDGAGNWLLDEATLIRIAHTQRLRRQLGVQPQVAAGWWAARLDTYTYATEGLPVELSPYDQRFLDRSVTDPATSPLRLDEPGRAELDDTSKKIADALPAVLGALRIDAAALDAAIGSLGSPPPTAATLPLNLANLTALARIAGLARAAKLPVADLVGLAELTGLDPFDPGHTEQAILLLAEARAARAAGMKVGDLELLLRHKEQPPPEGQAPGQRIAAVLEELRVGLRRILAEHVVAPDPIGDLTRRKLALVVDAATADRAVAIVAGTAVFTTQLAVLPQGITFPPNLAERVAYDAAAQELEVTGPLTVADRTALANLSGAAGWQAAVTALFDAPRELVANNLPFLDPPALTAALLDTAALTVEERFAWVLDRLVPHLHATLSRGLVKERVAVALGLPGVTAERLVAEWVPPPTGPAPTGMDALLALGALDQAPTMDNAADAWGTIVRLDKAARIITRLKLTGDEVTFAFEHGVAAGWLDLGTLPVAPVAADPAVYERWRRLAGFAALRQAFPAREPSLLGTLAAAVDATATPPADPAAARAALLEDLAAVTGWPLADLTAAAGPGQLNLAFPAAFADERGIALLRPWLALLVRSGVSAEVAWGWRAGPVTRAQAQAMRQAAKARHDPDEWAETAKLLRDPIRERQRDALVAFVMANPQRVGLTSLPLPSRLSEHLLVDVEMNACMPSSRIVLALASAQTFVQRAQMNLEPGVKLTYSAAKQWEWMRNYRVWEANRKVFVTPENWADPTLRDDKTPFFDDFEGELLQGDITADTAEAAFEHYLERLDEVARLEPAGLYHQVEETTERLPAIDVLHVVARTRSTPHRHFYRTRRKLAAGARWTPWAPIEVEIGAASVVPVIYNRRLYLFWPEYMEGSEETTPSQKTNPPPEPERFTDIKLGWTELRQSGAWAPKRLSDVSVRLDSLSSLFWPLISWRAEVDPATGDLLVCGAGWLQVYSPLSEGFRFSGVDGTISITSDVLAAPEGLPPGTHPWFQQFVEASTGVETLKLPYTDPLNGTAGTTTALETTPGGQYGLVRAVQERKFGAKLPFFFQDWDKTFFVVPEPDWTSAWFLPFESQTTVPGLVEAWHDKWGKLVAFDRRLPPRPGGPGDPWVNPVQGVVEELSFPVELAADGLALGGGRFLLARDGIASTRSDRRGNGGPNGDPNGGSGGPLRAGVLASPSAPLPRTEVAVGDLRRSGPDLTLLNTTLARQAAPVWGASPAGALGMRVPILLAGAGSVPASARAHVLAAPDGAKALFTKEKSWTAIALDPGAFAGEAIADALGVYSWKQYVQRYRFFSFYHPSVRTFIRELRRTGVDGVLQRAIQLHPEQFAIGSYEQFDFATRYEPTSAVRSPYPTEALDFSFGGAYAQYNWELFVHAPLLVAHKLAANQRWADALRWFHYVFDPTDATDDTVPRRFWHAKPFYDHSGPLPVEELFLLLYGDDGDPKVKAVREDFEGQIAAWRENPVNPHLLARLRPGAYMKATVMAYLDTLIGWGDQLFRRDTMESVNEATQLYLLAGNILGERPERVPQRDQPALKSFADLRDQLDAFSNALVALENELPPSLRTEGTDAPLAKRPGGAPAPASALGPTLYFCIPENTKLLGYWDLVADRLYKIRNCLNIEGVERQLALFAPPIDPAALVRAAAAGISIDQALNAASASALPNYRFRTMLRKAQELCGELRSFGSSLLGALERRDAEALELLRSGHEVRLLDDLKAVHAFQVQTVDGEIKALEAGKAIAKARHDYYSKREYMNAREQSYVDSITAAAVLQIIGQGIDTLAAGLAAIPLFDIGVSGAFSSPVTKVKFGGRDLTNALGFVKQALAMGAQIATFNGTLAAAMGGYDRRKDDWDHLADAAAKEMAQFDAQLAVGGIRKQLAERERDNQLRQLEDARSVNEVLRTRFTNTELYDWMVGQLAQVYFQAYQLAYDTAKLAERAFRYELGDPDATFVQFGYWDSLKKGLLAGERLWVDLQRMELAYLDQHERRYELTKHVSLALLDPVALVRLKTTGQCFIDLPEALFDLDHPGHHQRYLAQVSMSVPCVTGPYSGVHATLTLLRSSVRVSSEVAGGYVRTGSDDTRFVDSLGVGGAIVTSVGQEDAGLFEARLDDERYLPFEGAGAISRWRVELPHDTNHFDVDSVTDVVLHLRYRAKEGGKRLRDAARDEVVAEAGRAGARLLSARTDAADAWFAFRQPVPDGQQTATLTLHVGPEHLPFQVRALDVAVTRFDVLLDLAEGAEYPTPLTVTVQPPAGTEVTKQVTESAPLGQAPFTSIRFNEGDERPLGDWELTVPAAALAVLDIDDLAVIVHFVGSQP